MQLAPVAVQDVILKQKPTPGSAEISRRDPRALVGPLAMLCPRLLTNYELTEIVEQSLTNLKTLDALPSVQSQAAWQFAREST
jgi:hypothetical protein